MPIAVSMQVNLRAGAHDGSGESKADDPLGRPETLMANMF